MAVMPFPRIPASSRTGPLGDPVVVLILSCTAVLGWLIIAWVASNDIADIFAESGPVEMASAAFLMLAAGALFRDMGRRRAWGDWHLAVLALAAGLRELDWDKAFTDSGVLSLRLYSGTAPAGQKMAGGLVLILLVWAGLRLLRRDLVPWWHALQRGTLSLWLMLAVSGLYAAAKLLDGLGRKLASWGIELSEQASRAAGLAEEGLELAGAMLVLQAVALRQAGRPEPALGSVRLAQGVAGARRGPKPVRPK